MGATDSMTEMAYTTKGLTKVYGTGRSAVHALRGVDLEIPKGEIVVLLGPSGSGKSTLLNIIGGLDRPTEGTAFFGDQNLTEMSDRDLTKYRRQNIGFVFQFYNLMPSLTAHENVELVTEIADNPMDPDEALALVGLTDRVDHFPAQMSGGEQQRVAIARAVAKNPTVLFCDVVPQLNCRAISYTRIMPTQYEINERSEFISVLESSSARLTTM